MGTQKERERERKEREREREMNGGANKSEAGVCLCLLDHLFNKVGCRLCGGTRHHRAYHSGALTASSGDRHLFFFRHLHRQRPAKSSSSSASVDATAGEPVGVAAPADRAATLQTTPSTGVRSVR